MRFMPKRTVAAALAALLGAVASAQTPTSAPAKDTIYMTTTVGSFKFIAPSEKPTNGTMDIDFEGTVMVSGLVGSVVPGAGVRLEIERKDHDRQVYFGKGHLHVAGDFRAIQFFGRNLKGSFTGTAVARLYGEFDKNMETGYFWFASDPKKVDWGANGHNVNIPPQQAATPSKVKVRDVPKKGS